MNGGQTAGRGISVSTKLLTFATIIILILVAVLTALSIANAYERAKPNDLQKLTALYEHYNNDVRVLENESASLAISIADRPDVRRLYQTRDREGLLTLLTPLFDTLKTKYNIVHLYVEEPNGTVYLRVHDPERFGDNVTYRITTATALDTRQPVAGVEIGPNRLGVRGVAPMFDESGFIGVIEVGVDYDEPFIQQLKAFGRADYTMWVTYSASAPAGLKPKDGSPPSPSPNLFYYASTYPSPLPIPEEVYQRILDGGKPEVQYVSANGEEWVTLVAPLLGYGSRTIGVLEITTSRAETLTAIRNDTIQTVIVAALVALLSLVGMWLTYQIVVLRPLGQLAAVAERQLEGNLDARVQILPRDEFGQLGNTLNTLSQKLDDQLKTQESVIANRTRALALSSEISRRLSGLLDQKQLISEVVEQVRSTFNYYHAHIYLYDPKHEHLVMSGGTGEAARAMLARGHRIEEGRGLVGRAAATNAPVLVPDVAQDPGWLPNPLLPDTKAEVAVPIAIGGRVLGVLDVQHNVKEGLKQDDVELLQSIAFQVAIALQNARSFELAQRQADRETFVNTISQRIQSAGDVESVLQIAARELGQALDAQRATIQVGMTKLTDTRRS